MFKYFFETFVLQLKIIIFFYIKGTLIMAYVISKQTLMQKLDFNEEDLTLIFKVFVKTSQDILKKLALAIEENDYKCIQACANDLKGSSGNLLLDDVYMISKEIESASKVEDSIDYTSYYEQLDIIFSTLTLE